MTTHAVARNAVQTGKVFDVARLQVEASSVPWTAHSTVAHDAYMYRRTIAALAFGHRLKTSVTGYGNL